ncbi:MAG: TIGR03663 family protein [Opitutaceae bacterium]|nr:TIGR03663 family protein [Opitutaceae bacterium]
MFVVAALIAGACVLRLPDLSTRPFHTDEANNAYLLQEWLGGRFRYRAHDHHGPLLFHLAGPVMRVLGVTSVAGMEAPPLRLISVISGLALMLAPLLLSRYLGRIAALAASALLAVAAPFAYYNGIFIHESLLLACVMGFALAFWRARTDGSFAASVLAGTCAGLALATKETAAPILMLFVVSAWPGSPQPLRSKLLCALLALVAALVVVTTLFSTFWKFPRDAFALFKAIGPQFARGTGTEHAYPWYQYFSWYLAPTQLGLPWAGWVLTVGGVLGGVLGWRSALPRALSVWVILLVIFFSALSYKTPWLALAWLAPLAVLCGIAVDRLLRRRAVLALGLACACLAAMGAEAWSRCRTNSVEPGNVFAYSPSSRDLERLAQDLASITSATKEGSETLIQVVALDYWPLPWVLRRYPQTGYWSDVPTLENNAIVLLGPEYASAAGPARESLKAYSIRPGTLIFLRPPTAK